MALRAAKEPRLILTNSQNEEFNISHVIRADYSFAEKKAASFYPRRTVEQIARGPKHDHMDLKGPCRVSV